MAVLPDGERHVTARKEYRTVQARGCALPRCSRLAAELSKVTLTRSGANARLIVEQLLSSRTRGSPHYLFGAGTRRRSGVAARVVSPNV